mmetsp:Transcript_6247/g.10428  ORF Transcript_6247/g.10428 Transcript_6247/m.10428 type:complete len:1310 (-) Transcript_6247:80-4009(-)
MGNCHPATCGRHEASGCDQEEPSVAQEDGCAPLLFVDQQPAADEKVDNSINKEICKPTEEVGKREDTIVFEAVEKEPMSKEEQLTQVLRSDGIFAALDCKGSTSREGEELCSSILQSPGLSSSHVIGVILGTDALARRVAGVTVVEYLLKEKRVVPFISLAAFMGGGFDDGANYFDAITGAGVFGVESYATINCGASSKEVQHVVQQQLAFAKRCSEKSLMPVLRIEVSPQCSNRDQCEKLLCESLLQGLRKLGEEHPGVILSVACPSRANMYLPLLGHPKVLRIMARDLAASSLTESCKALSQNMGFAAHISCQALFAEADSFSRQTTSIDRQTSIERQASTGRAGSKEAAMVSNPLEQQIVASVQKFYDASRMPSVKEQQMVRVAEQVGFFVGLDHSRASGLEALSAYGAALPAECRDDDVFQVLHEFRSRVIRNSVFAGDRIVGCILSEDSLDRKIDGMRTAQYLWEEKRVVPYLRLFKSLAPEKNGVQLMKHVTRLDQLLDKAVRCGIFGTKTRTVIRLPKEAAIKNAVEQQFTIARQIMAKGLIPVMQIEVDINSPNRVKCERLLYDALMEALENLRHSERVILDLTVPSTPNVYLPLIGHPNTIRVTALSGGLACKEACECLSQNVGLVASFGRAFLEGLQLGMPGEAFTQRIEESCVTLFNASNATPTKEMQLIKVSSTDGIFAPLDKTGQDMAKTLQRYGIDTEGMSESAIVKAAQKRLVRILKNPKINGSVVIGVTLVQEFMNQKIDGELVPKYIWEQKQMVPFIKLGKGLASEKSGVRLAKEVPHLDAWLTQAKDAGIFGTKMRSVIRLASVSGIKAVVKQQFDLSKRVLAKGLIPTMMPEVDIKSPNKEECEHILCDELLEALGSLRPDERVLLCLTLPSISNKYLPLIHHPNCIRVIALSGGYTAEEACQMLAQNIGMIGGFERGLFSEVSVSQSEDDFTKALDMSSKAIFDASRTLPVKEEQMYKMKVQDGFLAALDQHRTDIPALIERYGIHKSQYKNSKEMEDRAFEMYSRIIGNSKLNGSRVIGVVIFEDFLDRDIDYMPCPQYMWKHKNMVPFLKVDRGLMPERDGVQLMKDVHRLDQMLDKASETGIFGTKARSVIRKPNPEGIRAAVEQQFEMAKRILSKNMVPIMHMEVALDATDKPSCERVLRQALMGVLRRLEPEQRVMFQVTLPSTPNAYGAISSHPNVIRVLAPSGGYTIQEACHLLDQNPGMIASFGRALISDLHVSQTDREFTQMLDRACGEIYNASRKTQGRERMATTPRGAHAEKDSKPATTPRSITPRSTTPRDDPSLGA